MRGGSKGGTMVEIYKSTAVGPTRYEEEYFTRHAYLPYRDFPNHATRVDRIMRLTDPKSLLDVGCAYGYIVKRLVAKGVDAYGCDISNWCQLQAAKIIPGRFVLASADSLPFPDKRFDVVYCEGVMEHLTEQEVENAFKEFERVSQKRILAVTFGKGNTSGHLCNHDVHWWYERMPRDSYLYTGEHDSSNVAPWWFKDAMGKLKVKRW